jgi:hypothetical protein
VAVPQVGELGGGKSVYWVLAEIRSGAEKTRFNIKSYDSVLKIISAAGNPLTFIPKGAQL